MRSLDLYSEKQLRDGSPDKIAASNAFVREANSLSLASLTPTGKDANSRDANITEVNLKDISAKDASAKDLTAKEQSAKEQSAKEQSAKEQSAKEQSAKEQTAKDTSSTSNVFPIDAKTTLRDGKDTTSHGLGRDEKTGLLSLFTDMPDTSKFAGSSDLRNRRAMSADYFSNPLSIFGMGALASREPMSRQELQIIAERSVVHERMQRVIARQAFLLGEKKLKSEKDSEKGERVNDTTVLSAAAASKKHKLSFVKDKVSIANGVMRPERIQQSKQPRDYVKENKLLKKKQMLVDYLEKFRGKLSLQEVSEVISQMEKLDKALLLMTK